MRPEQNLHDYSPVKLPLTYSRATTCTPRYQANKRSEPMNPSPDFQPPTPAASYPRFLSAINNVGIWVRRYAYREDLSSRQICRCWPFGSFRGGPLTARDNFSRGPVMMFLAISFRWPLEVPPSVSDGFSLWVSPRGAPICFRWPLPRILPLSQMALRLLDMVSLESSHGAHPNLFQMVPLQRAFPLSQMARSLTSRRIHRHPVVPCRLSGTSGT